MRVVASGGRRWVAASLASLSLGCASDRVSLPNGYLPAPSVSPDSHTAEALNSGPPRPFTAVPPAPPAPGHKKQPTFDLPSSLPGAGVAPVVVPKFSQDTPAAERVQRVEAAYPALTPVSAQSIPDGSTVSLPELILQARANHPTIRKAQADANAACGQVVQAGLHPNPTVGFQADQVQPGLRIPAGATFSGAGQQGGFINQLIKTAGKLSLSQQVAGYDYINALVAVRRAEVEVTGAVRTAFFQMLVAQQSIEVNRILAELADEVYKLQLKQVAAGDAAGYEPLLLYAQSVQARTVLAQAEASARAAWKQLAVALGQPDRPPSPLAGRADAPPPVFRPDELKARITEEHSDVLTARNAIAQAQRNLQLQQRQRIPDLQTNTYQQYDNSAQAYQFGVQVGISLPISDRNQGNIHSAQFKISSANQQLVAAQNGLLGKLAEAVSRYEASLATAENYRKQILPAQSQAYREIIQRYQVEPDKVSFNDIVVAQQTVATSLQTYLTALGTQWQAVVDVASTAQLDELYPSK